jgi:hypothetical protein
MCNAGYKVFFHTTSCEVTLDGKILRGWSDPKSCLLQVKIVHNGWTTQLTIHNETTRHPPCNHSSHRTSCQLHTY